MNVNPCNLGMKIFWDKGCQEIEDNSNFINFEWLFAKEIKGFMKIWWKQLEEEYEKQWQVPFLDSVTTVNLLFTTVWDNLYKKHRHKHKI